MVLPSTTDRTLCLMLWNKCNARCAHCGPSSGPKEVARNDPDMIHRLIQEAHDLYGAGWTLSVSGGEPFIYLDELYGIVKAAYQRKGFTTLVTNAYWATSVTKAQSVLQPLVDHGLKIMSISADIFHDPFIPFRRVVHALQAGQQMGLKVTVRVVGSKSSHASDIMNRLREHAVSYVEVMEMPLVPEGRARLLPRDEYLVKPQLPRGKCPSPNMTIDANSQVMVCCNGAGSEKTLQLGSARDHSLLELEYKFSSDPVLNFLRSKGPAQAIDFMEPADRKRVLGASYVNECDVCMAVFAQSTGPAVRSAIEQDFLKQMQESIAAVRRIGELQQTKA